METAPLIMLNVGNIYTNPFELIIATKPLTLFR
jgi:hypothetical protein